MNVSTTVLHDPSALPASGDSTEDLVLDCVSVLIKEIPYVGGVLSEVFGFFTSSSAVIEWEDIEDYVDAAIDEKLLEADIQRAKETLDNIRTAMIGYDADVQAMSLEERERSKDDYYLDLKAMEHDLLMLSEDLLGKEGYPDKQEEGLWHRAPYALLSTVGQMLVIHLAVIREMQAEIYARDADYTQNKLDDAITAYLAASWILLPQAYQQRMASLRYLKDERTEEILVVSHLSQVVVTYLVHWSDAWANKDVQHEETKSEPSNAQDNAHIARMNDARRGYHEYWAELNKTTTDEMYTTVAEPLDLLTALARSTVRDAESKRRADTGQTFGGVRCQVKVRADGANTPDRADVEATLYVAGEHLVPAMASQKLEDSRREMWSWCVGITAEAALYVRFGVWAGGKFDSTWSSTSPLVPYAPGSVPVAAVNGVNGKYDHLSTTATWVVPA